MHAHMHAYIHAFALDKQSTQNGVKMGGWLFQYKVFMLQSVILPTVCTYSIQSFTRSPGVTDSIFQSDLPLSQHTYVHICGNWGQFLIKIRL